MTEPSHAQNTYFHRDPFLNRRGDIRLSSRGASSRVALLAVKREAEEDWGRAPFQRGGDRVAIGVAVRASAMLAAVTALRVFLAH
jgi:hypothetical protein